MSTSKMKQAVRNCYQCMLPESVRLGVRRMPLVSHAIRLFIDSDTRFHDDTYDETYFSDERRPWVKRAGQCFSQDLMRHCSPSSVVDVGCGDGSYLQGFAEAGIEAHGVELAEAGLKRCWEAGLDVQKFDLTQCERLPWTADVVYSVEVAEHLLPRYADHFVRLLAESARNWVVFTAAKPGQEGTNHFNLQPKSYWIAKFSRHGFEYQHELTEAWEASSRERELPHWLCENLIVMRRERS